MTEPAVKSHINHVIAAKCSGSTRKAIENKPGKHEGNSARLNQQRIIFSRKLMSNFRSYNPFQENVGIDKICPVGGEPLFLHFTSAFIHD